MSFRISGRQSEEWLKELGMGVAAARCELPVGGWSQALCVLVLSLYSAESLESQSQKQVEMSSLAFRS